MTFASSQSQRTLIGAFIILAVIAETGAYLATTPHPSEPFFQFYVLGKNGLVADYYPQNRSDLRISSKITWYLGVTNSMGNVQLIEIRVKCANESTTAPNETSGAPSSASELTSLDRFLMDNQTWELPFIWVITSANTTDGSVRILTIQINNETYRPSDWSALNGYNFRLIFELWVWQTSTNTFEFGWNSNGEQRTAWLQIWFNMTNPAPPPLPA